MDFGAKQFIKAFSIAWKQDFKNCWLTTFWLGWMINAFFVGIGLLVFMFYPEDALEPRIVDAFLDLFLGIILTVLVFGSHMKTPSISFLLQNNLRQVTIELFRTLLRTLIGYLFLILPGLYLTAKYLFVPFVVMSSRKYQAGEVDALKESWRLSKGVTPVLIAFYIISQALVIFVEIGVAPALKTVTTLTSTQELVISTVCQLTLSYPLQVLICLILARLYLMKVKDSEVPDELAI
jgi:hypothetical protein